MPRLFKAIRNLRRDTSGVALLEFAYGVPVFLVMAMTGSELANFITTKMRMSQVALHLADHAARMGSGSLLAAKTISETQINDVLTGAGLQAGKLDLYKNGRVILTNLEEDPANAGKYKITWQRCRGDKAHTSTYGFAVTGNLVGIGPVGRKVTAPEDGATMFVEVYYEYQPIIAAKFVSSSLMQIREIASMTVRERRDLTTPIPNPDSVAVSNCG